MSKVSNRRSMVADLYAKYWRPLTRTIAKSVGTMDEAEDIVQESFQRIFSNNQLSEMSDPAGYLRMTARNILIDRRRHQKVEQKYRPEMSILDYGAQVEVITPERIVAGREEMSALQDAIEALPPKRRAVFVMSRIHNLSYREISRRIGISEGTVEKHVWRSLVQIGRQLETSSERGAAGSVKEYHRDSR